jgi:hypothetical protein
MKGLMYDGPRKVRVVDVPIRALRRTRMLLEDSGR